VGLGARTGRETERKIVVATRALAKRQKTWFARERRVVRVRPEEALAAALSMLNGETGKEADADE
jgi:tRNA A37 N6-isopentenylltransferase MiaA